MPRKRSGVRVSVPAPNRSFQISRQREVFSISIKFGLSLCQNPNQLLYNKGMKQTRREYTELVKDLFAHDNVRQMSEFIQHGNVSCLHHSKRVSYKSYKICKFLKLDYKSAARGGLLHDYFLYDWHEYSYRMHGLTHPKRALANANRDFKLNKIEQDIIKKHMWPITIIPPRHLESLIVCLVDKYCSAIEVFRSVEDELNHVDEFFEDAEVLLHLKNARPKFESEQD